MTAYDVNSISSFEIMDSFFSLLFHSTVKNRTDCAVCICNGYFDLCEVQCLEEPSESPTESPTFGPDDDDK